eukprot:CAMPEP_0183832422 /NCGR_PEP_ID=MMETSP0807_2-20130328/5341_1 /TAXON_ID=88271 /ORGANISM="Picocystis salinarum, Strain CCMP1897" /LENGTH=41 /DNA_ID= /DNA_START= /DNA_END= /DNA_ORIENTATION=
MKQKASDLCDLTTSMRKVSWQDLLRKRTHAGNSQVDRSSKG